MEQNVSCYDVEHGIPGCKIWDGWKQYPGWKSMSTGTDAETPRLDTDLLPEFFCKSSACHI